MLLELLGKTFLIAALQGRLKSRKINEARVSLLGACIYSMTIFKFGVQTENNAFATAETFQAETSQQSM